MDPHPDFAGVEWPRQFALGDLLLTPLSPEFVDEDFDAVMASADVVDGIFGTWPSGLTRESNLIDLAWHDREFTAKRSFSWIVRNARGTYIGCFYLYPLIGGRGAAKAALWLCDVPSRLAVAQDLKAALDAWLTENLPPDISVTWTTRPILE